MSSPLIDSLIYAIPPAIVVTISIPTLIAQKISRSNYDEIPQEGPIDDVQLSADTSRFSTVSRDVIKSGTIILQLMLNIFLFGCRYDQNYDFFSVICAGVLSLCLVNTFYIVMFITSVYHDIYSRIL